MIPEPKEGSLVVVISSRFIELQGKRGRIVRIISRPSDPIRVAFIGVTEDLEEADFEPSELREA